MVYLKIFRGINHNWLDSCYTFCLESMTAGLFFLALYWYYSFLSSIKHYPKEFQEQKVACTVTFFIILSKILWLWKSQRGTLLWLGFKQSTSPLKISFIKQHAFMILPNIHLLPTIKILKIKYIWNNAGLGIKEIYNKSSFNPRNSVVFCLSLIYYQELFWTVF